MKRCGEGSREVFVRESPMIASTGSPEFSPEVIPSVTRSAAVDTSTPGTAEAGETPHLSLKEHGIKGDATKEHGSPNNPPAKECGIDHIKEDLSSKECEMDCIKESGLCMSTKSTPARECGIVKLSMSSNDSPAKECGINCIEESGPSKDLPSKECGNEEDSLGTCPSKERGIYSNKEDGTPPRDPAPTMECGMDTTEEYRDCKEVPSTHHSPCSKDSHTSGKEGRHTNEGGMNHSIVREMPEGMSADLMPPHHKKSKQNVADSIPLTGIFSRIGQKVPHNESPSNTSRFPQPKKIKLDAVFTSGSLTGIIGSQAGPRPSLELRMGSEGNLSSEQRRDKMRLEFPLHHADIEVGGRSKPEGGGAGEGESLQLRPVIDKVNEGVTGVACPKLVSEEQEEGAGEMGAKLVPEEKEGVAGVMCPKLAKEGGAGEMCPKVVPEEGVAGEVCPKFLPEGEGGAQEICPKLSPEVKEGGAEILFSPEFEIGHSMLNTQMNRQINRVESFLKMDRLKRQKPINK